MGWQRCRSTRRRFRRDTDKRLFLLLILAQQVGRSLREPVEEVAGFPEAPWVRRGAKDDDRDLIARRHLQERDQTVTGL